MEYRTLGRTGMRVSPLCLGAMMFGDWGNTDHDESVRIIHAALEAGINFIDTADVYSNGESEKIVAKAIAGRRDDVVLATKFGSPMSRELNRAGGSRHWIMKACDASLRRLGTDHIDLYQLHRPDPSTDIDETLASLSDLVHQGKIRYIGTSKLQASEIVEAHWTAERRGRERPVCEQPPYSILVRAVETDVLPTCQRHGMGVISWSPLAGGWLSGRYRAGVDVPVSTRSGRVPQRYDMTLKSNQEKLEMADALGRLADERGLSLIEMSIAWVINNPAITSAIIGPRTMAHLQSHLPSLDAQLDDDLLDRIDEIVPPGTNPSISDSGYVPPVLANARLRRRGR